MIYYLKLLKTLQFPREPQRRTRRRFQLIKTIEFYPDEGRYHFDGHANCKIALHPREAIKIKNICPVCGKPLTLGVLHRVEELADRKEAEIPKNRPRIYLFGGA